MNAIAKRMKTGKYKIDLPIDNNSAEIAVMVIVEVDKKKNEWN